MATANTGGSRNCRALTKEGQRGESGEMGCTQTFIVMKVVGNHFDLMCLFVVLIFIEI